MDVQAIDPAQTTSSSAPAGPVATIPSATVRDKKVEVQDETLHRALSQLAGGGSKVSVQFRVSHHPNEIVTVFKNAETGEEIAQFPAETMIQIAQFFDKLAGAVVDRNA